MENILQEFVNEKFGKLRFIEARDEIWFVDIDAANSLGYSDANTYR